MMRLTTSTRTVIAPTLKRIPWNSKSHDAQKATFPLQRLLSHFARQSLPQHPRKCVHKISPTPGSHRWLSTAIPEGGSKPPVSPHIGFYQMFGRPVFKVFLMAMITYQALYWTWLKLETVEEWKDKTEEVAKWEAELERVRPAKK